MSRARVVDLVLTEGSDTMLFGALHERQAWETTAIDVAFTNTELPEVKVCPYNFLLIIHPPTHSFVPSSFSNSKNTWCSPALTTSWGNLSMWARSRQLNLVANLEKQCDWTLDGSMYIFPLVILNQQSMVSSPKLILSLKKKALKTLSVQVSDSALTHHGPSLIQTRPNVYPRQNWCCPWPLACTIHRLALPYLVQGLPIHCCFTQREIAHNEGGRLLLVWYEVPYLTCACISCRGINSWCTISSRAPSLQKLSDFRPDTRGRVVNAISWLWSCYITKENGWLRMTSEHATITVVMSLYRDSVMNRGKYNITYLSK